MNAKLDNITTQYRKFNENQALTEGQLNEFIDYFEDQDRLSRTRLSGVGVVCGFQSTYIDFVLQPDSVMEKKSGSEDRAIDLNFNTIAITQGAGVTTDGDLITLRQKTDKEAEVTIDFTTNTYKYFRNYTDKVGYKHFLIGGKQIPLLELITQEEYTQLKNQGVNVGDFKHTKEITNIYGKTVILYLESYSNEESPCQDADCDNTGAEQVSNLKVLLADSNSVLDLIKQGDAKDTIYNVHNSYEELFDQLPKIEAKRVILDPAVVSAKQLKEKFQNAIGSVAELSKGFNAIASTFNVSVNLGGQPLFDKLDSLLKNTVRGFDDYQYRYDLLKDLIDTYNEIKGLILHLNAECCPAIASFPKHLMLGAVGAAQELGKYIPLRHGFYHSPVTTNDDENYERVVMLANRFVQKINGFQSYMGAIKITPSNLYVRLGEKAIPYYYNVDKPLLAQWNFEKTKTDREVYNLSYHTANLAGDDFVQNPLIYNIDNNDFYRIEGHLTLPYKTALQNINDLKTKYGLAFDVIALVLEKGEKPTAAVSNEKTVSIDDLRKQLTSISSDISNRKGDSQNTLLNISKLDEKLRLLNKAEFAKDGSPEGVTVVKQDPKKDDVVSELLSEFLERKSGLEHVAGVEPGGTFVLIYASETYNQVLADFSLPYLCCSKKEPVFLMLPDSKLCQKDAPIAMTIVPQNGEVKAFINGTQIPAVTQSGGQSFFDPSLVNAAYFGQTITFTVNDDLVEAQMVVYPQPNVSVTTGGVSYDAPTTDENANNPDATVEFKVAGDFTGLTFTWNFDDGTPVQHNEAPANIKTYVYKLVAGQEKTFNPILTVTNANGCSTVYKLAPLKLKGQSTIACLSGMRVVIQYRDDIDTGHVCNDATFNLTGNDIVIGGINPYPGFVGNIHLSNTGGNQDRNNHKPGTPPLSRYNEIIITQAEAKLMASKTMDGFVEFSLECALPVNNRPPTGCHQDVAYTEIFLANATVPIYKGYPNGNFLKINPCTGVTK
ncbi:PKD domain-containing protein [Chryseobacterium sp. MEBOG07]|uniref:PKD domain-containing protein n=1 Tax=Chryseobacterium sp. MEBOG07 TaxID=2879939 RepID=UPI001F234994|nr:PKD domain-containing protein [Chryseobacterium sp. MEBOG07]UKB81176.1 PKD domain-containing protein [Chryseobacterium sp. MEBOG07]